MFGRRWTAGPGAGRRPAPYVRRSARDCGRPPLVRAARACAGCELVNVISVAITAATTHITTAAAAVVAPGLPRIVSRPTSLAARGNHAGCSNFARRVARRRYVSASRGRPTQSPSTCSRIRGEAWVAGQTGQSLRAQRAAPAARAGLALLDVPTDQAAHLAGQPPIPAGQKKSLRSSARPVSRLNPA